MFLNPILSRHRFHPASPLIYYCLVFFFVAVGDAIMSYLSPVYIQSLIKNTFLMGLIIATSSVAGFCCDFLFARIFPGRPYAFFFWLALLAAFLFPGIFITLPPLAAVFIIGMITWGVYYELLQFSHFNFISHHLPKSDYHLAWGTISSFKALAYILGPIIAGFVITSGFRESFRLPLIFYTVAALGFFILITALRHSPHQPAPEPEPSVRKEFNTWMILFRKVWQIYVFLFLISCIDSAFWTVGTLISEELRQTSSLGSLFLPAYTLPALFIGLAVSRLPAAGKKKTALLTGSIAGLILSLVGLINHPVLLVVTVFTSSAFLSVAYPEIAAVFEDYVNRLGHQGINMVGLESSAISSSFVIGPILAGGLAQVLGNRQVFTVLGLILAGYSLLTYFIIPRKIRLPEAEIAQVLNYLIQSAAI